MRSSSDTVAPHASITGIEHVADDVSLMILPTKSRFEKFLPRKIKNVSHRTERSFLLSDTIYTCYFDCLKGHSYEKSL
jgi:hypothetical protein